MEATAVGEVEVEAEAAALVAEAEVEVEVAEAVVAAGEDARAIGFALMRVVAM